MNFIFVSLQRINTDRESTSTSLAKELAKEHQVLYVNPPIDRKAWLLPSEDVFIQAHIKQIKEGKTGLVKDENNLWVLTPGKIIESLNWIPSTSVFSFFNKFNNKRFAGDIKKAIKQLNFNNFNLIIDKDIFRSYYLKELLKPKFTIYLDRDYTLGFDYWKRHGVTLEPKLMSKCDAVVCNSMDFTKKDMNYNLNSFYISNGANLNIFNAEKDWQEPAELVGLARPIVGYVGALTSTRLDISLIENIAKNLNRGSLVLIGPEDDGFLNSELHQIPNVHFIPKMKTEIVPSYLSYFDVCINPQLLNEITLGNFPLKIVEYLAMGKPIVGTATNTMKEVFSNHSYLALTPAEFNKQIAKAIAEDNELLKAERISFSKNFSWKKVTANLLQVIQKLKETV
ncbi:teichuronic acid biosynthesis glycosyltransferase TuaH [Pedobacter sp. CG_S7]|uniref:glycosyltransferase n=1 Tax=Pedobacter sp. CG_S7 TaxID=3143930 RepID=UPI003398FFB9